MPPGAVGGAVDVRGEAVVGPARHEVADIDDEGADDRRYVDPAPGAVQDLEARIAVLRQDRERLVVGMGADAEPRFLGGARRIVQQPEGACGAVELVQEVALGQRQGEREGTEQRVRGVQHGGIVGLDGLAKAWHVRGPEVGAVEQARLAFRRVAGCILAAEVDRLVRLVVVRRGVVLLLEQPGIAAEIP